MKKDTMTLEKAKQTPAGGVLVGKREGQTIIHDKGTQGGYFVGRLHKENGIKGINKTTGQPIEVQGGEVIITAPAVADQTKREFEGQMLTNREILSKINEKGGGVSFEQGGDVPNELYYTGSSYNYGGKTMTDYEIMQAMNGCGCDEEYKNGGNITDYQKKIADLKRENKSTFPKVPTNKIFFNKVEVLPASVVSTADPYLEDETKLPTESVDLKSIVPSQRNVTIPNIESTKDVESYPILFKLNDKYYVLDGHHRITNAILKDEKEVMAYVYDYKAQNLEFGGLSKGKSVEDIANMHNVSVSEINSQLKKGKKVESEHTSDKKLAEKIAKDHLVENPNYYTILDKVGLENGGEIETALNDLEKARSVKGYMQPEFNSEIYDYPKQGKANTYLKKVDNNSETILAYDNNGEIVGLFSISTNGNEKGAFKIVVREDSINKGWGKKILDEAEKQNIDIVGNIKNNSFTSSGRYLLRSWLKSKNKFDNGGEIENLIKEGKIDLKFYETTPSHAREYGIECKKPIYIQTLYITKENRLNGLGKKILKYLDDYCKKNANDVIFGHVSNKVEFTKDERINYLSDVELMKYWLHDNGYAVNDDNNDFHKVVNVRYNQIENNKKFINWFVGWYKDAVYKKMNIIMSIPFFDYNYGVDNVNKNNVVVLDIFEKKDQNIDAKKYLKEICDKADDYGIIIFLEPEPRFNYIQDNESKKQKITKEYLIDYYSRFDFEEIKNKEFLIRFPKNKNKMFNNGGQLDLVEESKKGDHPARDFSNYTDVVDVAVDGQVGAETGLAFADGGELSYAGGGATLSAEVFEWDKVPTNYRNITKVKKVPFTNNPMDKGLYSIISSFLGKDELRQSVMGVNFDENGITATNLHMLITLPYPNEKYNGIYDITGAKKQKSSELLLINENYPKYLNIIPDYKNAGTPYLIDVYKLLQYTKTAMNYVNKTTRAIAFKFGNNQAIGFNGFYLSEVLTAFLKLGYENIYAFITASNRAMVLSPNKNYELGNDDILLLMPVMINFNDEETKTYGAEDIDYKRSLKAYFDFNDSEIHNADGSVAKFKMQYENNLSVDDSYLGLLNKITSKNQKLAILNCVKVENGKMTATDLDISLIVKDVNMPDGIYEIVNKAPNITMNPIEDFPKLTIFKSNEVIVNHNGSKPTAFEFVTFSEVFEFYLDKLLLSVGKDDLRPTMSGICIKKTAENEIFLVTTNANTLCKINITEYCEFDKDDRELEYILPVKYLKDFVKLADGSLHFKCSKANIFIESDNLEYIGRTIDGKYPNYDAVIPRDNTKKIVFDHVAMNKCLKSPEVANQVAKYKGDKDIVFTLSNEGNNLFLKVQKDKGYNAPFEFIDKIQLCEIDFNYQQVDTNISLDKSVFLLMPYKDEFKENQYFAFRKDFFEVMLNTITDTEVECYFSEPHRAYIFPIDAIDYKKTLPEEKTKQQPKKVAKAKKEAVNVEKEQVREAIETLLMLAELEKDEQQRKEIYEALEVINMLKEESFESGGMMSRKLTFEPIRTPLN